MNEKDERGAILVEALEETQGLLAAMLHETRSADEIAAQLGDNRTALQAYARAASTSANVAQGAEAVGEVVANDPVHGWHFQPYIGWQELGAGTKLYAAPPVQTALTDDARECLMDVVSHHHNFRTACLEIKMASETTVSDELYWQKQIDVLDRMKAQAERALTASQSASGETK